MSNSSLQPKLFGALRKFKAEIFQVLAHPTRRNRGTLGRLGLGGKVRLEMSPFDMSKGRILGVAGSGVVSAENI